MAEKSILVPVDLEDAAPRLIAVAKWLAGAVGAEVALVHVHDRPRFTHPELPEETVARIESLADQAARKALDQLAVEVGARWAIFRHGDPAEGILAAADEVRAAMIVMGTHGRKGLGRLLMGSVAAHVVRAAKVPVVTVKGVGEEP